MELIEVFYDIYVDQKPVTLQYALGFILFPWLGPAAIGILAFLIIQKYGDEVLYRRKVK